MTGDSDQPLKRVVTQRVTSVRTVLRPFGRNRTNPPSLEQLRVFVAACEGLPDDTEVHVEKGPLDEGGRHTYTLSIRIIEESDGS